MSLNKLPVSRFMLVAVVSLLLVGGVPQITRAQTDTGTGLTQDIGNKKVSLNLEGADIRYALKLLFNSVGANFALDPGVQGNITVSLTDVSFNTALSSILRSSSLVPLTYRVESGVYQISPKEEPVTEETTNTSTSTTNSNTSQPKYRPVKITVSFADVNTLAYVLGGTIIPNMSNMNNNNGGYGNNSYGNNGYGNNSYGNGFGNSFGNNNNRYGNNNNRYGNSTGNGYGNSSYGSYGSSYGSYGGGFGSNNYRNY